MKESYLITLLNRSSIASLYFGASIIEKHFTLNKKNSPDGPFSLDENELKLLVKNANAAFIAKVR